MASILKVDTIQDQDGNNIINESADTITIGASGDTITIPSGASMSGFTSTGIDDNASSTAITIDSSQQVGIGTASPSVPLHVVGSGNTGVTSDTAIRAYSLNGTAYADLVYNGINASTNSGNLLFSFNQTERMRIDSSGNVRINTTAALQEGNERLSVDGLGTFDEDNGLVLCINRRTSDGGLVSFRQNGTQEGTIDVSGSAVSYNGFTGTHWSRFTDNSKPTILRGTVLESLDEMCDWYNLEFDVTTQDENGNDIISPQKIPHILTDGQSDGDVITYNYEGTDYQATIVKEADIKHMKSKVSDTVDAKNVYGVFSAYDEDGEGYNDFYVASVGSFVVRIKQGETIAKGDLLQSNGDGTAKVQTDDAVRSSSFAKVLSTTIIETYEDGSFIVPCSLMC